MNCTSMSSAAGIFSNQSDGEYIAPFNCALPGVACGITASDNCKSVTKSAVFVAASILKSNILTSVIAGLLAEPINASPRNNILTELSSPMAN